MKAFALLMLSAVASHAGSGGGTESGVFIIPRVRAAAEKNVPEKARQTLDALWPALHAAQRAWPGYDALGKPLLVAFSDGSALMVGHPAPPAEFRRITYRSMTAYVAERGPTINFDFRLDYEFGGARVTAVREEPELPPRELVLLAVHERFHDFQKGFRFTPEYRKYAVEEGEDVALAALENLALAAWLETADEGAIFDFAALRLRRRALFPDTTAEISEENLEGTAQYVEAKAHEAVEGGAAARGALMKKLRSPVAVKDMPKSRLYSVGAVLGLMLESRTPGTWQRQVESGRSISELLLQGLPLNAAEAAERAARLTKNPEYARLLASGRQDAENLQRRRTEFRIRYESQPGRRVELKNKGLQGGFEDDGEWFYYADGTRLHEHVVEWVGEGKAGRFRLSDRMVLDWYRGNDRVLEFFAGPEAEILIDGLPWQPDQGTRKFRTFSIIGRGVDLQFNGGRIEFGAGKLVVVPDGAD